MLPSELSRLLALSPIVLSPIGLAPFVLAGWTFTAAVAGDSVRPVEPAEGATTGPRPVFRIVATGPWEPPAHVRIELSRDRFKTIERSWDTHESHRGWTLAASGDAGASASSASLDCPELLPEGSWEWRAHVASKGAEIEFAKPASFRVDATPPADVTGLRLERRTDGAVSLTWDPVVNDVEGKPETVDRYVVYRYDTRGIFSQARASEAGSSRTPSFVDRSDAARTGALRGGALGKPRRGTLYYKVVAVDAAGNELGRRDSAADRPAR